MARKAAAKGPLTGGVVSLKVTLRGSKPPIWRRVLVADSMTLADLHEVIQTVMDWQESHLHAFDVGGRQYGVAGSLDDVTSETKMTLSGLRRLGMKRFSYTYDFGDDWEHLVEIERKPVADLPASLPRCIGGRRASPPEDCGGIWGYQDLLVALADPSHPDHAELSEQYGENLRPDHFDIDAINLVFAATSG